MSESETAAVGIEVVEYRLPQGTRTVTELDGEGKLITAGAILEGFGFRTIHVAQWESACDLALSAARGLLEAHDIDAGEIDLLFHASALPASAALRPSTDSVMAPFRFPVSRLQDELGLHRANAIGLGQQGCVSLFSAIRIARDMLLAEPRLRSALCVASDVLPADASREMLLNVICDGACAALLRRDSPRNRIVAFGQITKGAYWDTPEMENEIVAAYFPTARTVIRETLDRAGLELGDVAWIVPHNVSLRSWEILTELLEFPLERLYTRNIARYGHTMSADNLINLKDLADEGLLKSGDHLLLFTFGFGLNWSSMILRH